MKSLAVFYPEGHEAHVLSGHPERPARVEAVQEGLQQAGYWQEALQVEPEPLSEELLNLVHRGDYLDRVRRMSAEEKSLDLDTYTTEASWHLARRAAAGGIAVARSVWEGRAGAGFALTRPPGHHATRERGMGFCLLNNVALAAEDLIQNMGVQKLAIVDIDLHHGNGTQDIFWDRDDVFYFSSHQHPYYPGTGGMDERGVGVGEGWTLNVPLPAGSGDQAYQAVCQEVLLPALDPRRPGVNLESDGLDAH